MKKLLLTLAAGAALTIGLAGHSAPASAAPVGPTSCGSEHRIPAGAFVDVDGDGNSPLIDTCSVTNLVP
jgi:hypothetical protein